MHCTKIRTRAEIGDRLATETWAEKWGCCAPFRGERAGSSSDTMSPGPRPISVPSGILVIQPFGHNTNVTERQLSDSIGRTVLQTVAKKLNILRRIERIRELTVFSHSRSSLSVVDLFLF